MRAHVLQLVHTNGGRGLPANASVGSAAGRRHARGAAGEGKGVRSAGERGLEWRGESRKKRLKGEQATEARVRRKFKPLCLFPFSPCCRLLPLPTPRRASVDRPRARARGYRKRSGRYRLRVVTSGRCATHVVVSARCYGGGSYENRRARARSGGDSEGTRRVHRAELHERRTRKGRDRGKDTGLFTANTSWDVGGDNQTTGNQHRGPVAIIIARFGSGGQTRFDALEKAKFAFSTVGNGISRLPSPTPTKNPPRKPASPSTSTPSTRTWRST